MGSSGLHWIALRCSVLQCHLNLLHVKIWFWNRITFLQIQLQLQLHTPASLHCNFSTLYYAAIHCNTLSHTWISKVPNKSSHGLLFQWKRAKVWAETCILCFIIVTIQKESPKWYTWRYTYKIDQRRAKKTLIHMRIRIFALSRNIQYMFPTNQCWALGQLGKQMYCTPAKNSSTIDRCIITYYITHQQWFSIHSTQVLPAAHMQCKNVLYASQKFINYWLKHYYLLRYPSAFINWNIITY